jgi:hypothetical protein
VKAWKQQIPQHMPYAGWSVEKLVQNRSFS